MGVLNLFICRRLLTPVNNDVHTEGFRQIYVIERMVVCWGTPPQIRTAVAGPDAAGE